MKVTLQKYGGLAGLRLPPKVLDSRDLPHGAAAELERLVREAKAAPTPPDGGPGSIRDGMGFEIRVEDNGPPTALPSHDGAVTPAITALRLWIERHLAGK